MAPPSRLPRHGDVRPAAPADRRALPAGARRLGRGKRGLAHVERRRRGGPPALRRVRRRGCRLGCSRPGDRQPGRADRGGPSRDAEVVTPGGEFTSLLFPFLVQQERGVTVREVPLESLADSIGPRTTLVAWSAVQSSDGRLADNDAVVEAAAAVGALTVVDATQATGWLRVPHDRVDATVCSAYKWLCCPRGTAFMVASPRVLGGYLPNAASWFAADEMHAGYYGTPLRLAAGARRFDMSPAWFSWMGAVTSLSALSELGMDAIHGRDVAPRRRAAQRAGSRADGLGHRGGRRRRPGVGPRQRGASRRRRAPVAAGSRSTSTTTRTTSRRRSPALREGARELTVT